MASWFDIEEIPVTPTTASAEQADLDKARASINKIIDDLNAKGVTNNNIIVGGFSQGGSMAIYSAFSREKDEDKLAGCVCLSGWVQEDMENRISKSTKDVKETKLFWGHGSLDPMVQSALVKKGVATLKSWGVKNVDTYIVPGMAHSASDDELDKVKEFISAQFGL